MKVNQKFLAKIEKEYKQKFDVSHGYFSRGSAFFPNQVSHSGRFFSPFPIYAKSAKGSIIKTVDNENIIDFWQGHFCNILGHNPGIIKKTIINNLNKDIGLQLGQFTELEAEVASLLKEATHFESFIFSTSGGLSTMHAIMLGLAYSKRDKILKISGGWHGAYPWALKGVKYPYGIDKTVIESAGISKKISSEILVTPFNEVKKLEECFKKHGHQIGVFVLELVLGNSGMIVANSEFVKKARELSTKYGVVLVIDEMVTGFRARRGGFYEYYGIKPDLVTFGKSIAGGMPFACIAGKKEILLCASTENKLRVWADAGTFTSHPMVLLAIIEMLKYFKNNEYIFNKTIEDMNYLRSELKKVFNKHKVDVHITGESNDEKIPNFPIGTVRFINNIEEYDFNKALIHWDKEKNDIKLRDNILKKYFLNKGIFIWQGLGMINYSHKKSEIKKLINTYDLFFCENESFQ